jgi:hypothetical protein
MARVTVTMVPRAGNDGIDRPASFSLGNRTFRVRDVVDRWHGADHAYVKLVADDGNIYVLRHDLETDAWEMVLMEALPRKHFETEGNGGG